MSIENPYPQNDPFAGQMPVSEEEKHDETGSAEKSACAIVVIIVLILVGAGFGVWYYLTHREDKTPEANVSISEDNTGTKDDNMISAARGGKVVFTDNSGRSLEVIIPAGALTKDTKIEVERVSEGDITDLFHLKPDGLKFLKPVTIVVPYKASGLTEYETPEDIKLRYWFKTKSGRQALDFTVDRETKTLRTQVREF